MTEHRVAVALDDDGWTSANGTVIDTWVEGGREFLKVAFDSGREITVPTTTTERL